MMSLSSRTCLAAILLPALLGACATRPPTPGLYDLGPLPQAASSSTSVAASSVRPGILPAVALADPRSPPWLSGTLMFYRMLYVNDQQPRAYAENRWAMAPAQLFRQRLAGRIADAGGIVAASRDTGPTLPVLQLEMDEFSHVFATPNSSDGRIAVRASLFDGRRLVAQRTFRHDAPAPTEDAAGGAHALSRATDALITDLLQWLSTPPIARQ